MRLAAIVLTCVAAGILGSIAWGDEGPITPAQARKAWKHGHLEYLHVPLKIVIPSVNVHSKKPIVLADESVGNLLFSGTVFEDQVTDWLRALTITLPVVVIEGDDRIVISMRRDSEGSRSQDH
jgi:ferric-dicitrate binding protein FerR (iron transport regulator)